MPYIGKQPTVGNFQVCDAISVVNGQAAYTMQVGSANVTPETAFHMLVSLNGVLQKPGSSFTISGSTITFASNLATGDVIDFIILLGDVLNIGTPSDGAVVTASIADNAVTAAKLASGAGGKIGQVVSTTKTDTESLSVGSGSLSSLLSGLTVNITPSASSSNASTQWTLKDNKRNTFNPCTASLYPNLNAAEDSDSNIGIDFLSNGFKLYGNYSGINASGYTYIYMAFAESPFVNSNSVPTNAR